MRRGRAAVIAAVAISLYARDARGEDVVTGVQHIQSESTLISDGGSILRLPPGYFLPDAKFNALDLELRRLQEQEVRLDAENRSLRKSAETWSPGWKTLTAVFTVGVTVGVLLK